MNPPERCCCSRARRRCRAQRARRVGVPEHERDVRAQPDAVRRVVDREPLRGRHLVGADDAPHLVVEHLGCRPGQRPEPEVAQVREVLLERQVERRRALPHLERRERVDVDLRHRLLDGPHDVGVVVAGERGVDPTLEAHLRRAALPRLLRRGGRSPRAGRDTARRAGSPRASPSRTRRSRSGSSRRSCTGCSASRRR